MHSYPAWKIWLVVIVLLVGTVLALPNVFGEAPALQLSRNDRTAVTDAQRQQVVSTLQSKDVAVENVVPRGRSTRPALRRRERAASRRATSLQQGSAARIPGRAVRRAPHAGLDARARAEADEPRPRPARRRLLHVRSRRAGRREAAAHRAWRATTARCCARNASRSPAWPATASTRSGSACAAATTRSKFASLLRKQDPNLSRRHRHARRGRLRHGPAEPDAGQAAAGLRDPAEHHHAAQSRRRTRRHRADRRPPGPRPHRRATAGRRIPTKHCAAGRDSHPRVPARGHRWRCRAG